MNVFPKRSHRAEQLAVVVVMLLHSSPLRVSANPAQPVVSQGAATFSSQGSQFTVQTSGNAFINWGSFNIGAGETTRFIEPSATSVVWNRVNSSNPSQILGQLDANGYLILQNQSGFYVGGQAVINAAGLIMTTTPAVPLDVFGGGAWEFDAPPPTAKIINYGQIYAGAGAPVFLIANDIENHGGITAPGGNIGLYAGEQVMVSSRPDGRGLSAQVSLPAGSVDNTGKLIADAGTIALSAQVVNQGGLIQANSVREQNGVIEVVAGDALTLGSGSVIQANGDAQAASPGGNVTLQSGNTFSDQVGSAISVAGGGQGGAGGVVEISAPSMSAINSTINGQAGAGSPGGRLVIDPTTINIGNTGADSAGSGTVNAGDAPATLNLNVNSAFTGFSQIDLQASQDINLADGTTWDLVASTGKGSSGAGCQLTLEAGNDINFGTSIGASLIADGTWSVTLEAGRNFSVANTVAPGVPNTAAPGTVIGGVGNINLYGNSVVQALGGSLSLLAGDSITVQSGAIRTLGGGSIDVNALSGNVNSGNNPNGYVFKQGGIAPVSTILGGISTADGGNVTISAGDNVTSFLPTGISTSPSDAGSGAFGPEPGVVTVTAGGNVYGHFVAADSVRNGTIVASTITAETGDAGTAGSLLALSLATGGWQVNAPDGSIYLQEVRNPNGTLNGAQTAAIHVFNYDPNSFVDLAAAYTVDLEGTLLPRVKNAPVQIIYPPTLTINAGSGGVILGNSVTLYPSPDGELNITTTGGGSFEGANYALTMSDSGADQWTGATTFSATDHAAVPVQLNNPNPVVFNISGDMDDVTITTPKATQITVGGSMNNTSFAGQNLHASDVTFIDVAGPIFNQSTYSFVSLNGAGLPLPAPLYPGAIVSSYLQVLLNAVSFGTGPSSPNGGAAFPSLSLFYLPATGQLGYYGQMDAATVQALEGTLYEKTYNPFGQALLDASGNYITQPVTFNVPASIIAALYAASQNSINPANAPAGLQVGGPGQFNITAQSLDLGVARGVISEGPAANPALAGLATVGANININVQGDVDLFASEISSYYNGSISIYAGGAINAGLQGLPFLPLNVPLGIWTVGEGGDVTVIAQNNINVEGSRIAAFDGGNLFVESLQGSVDAGDGNAAQVEVNEAVVNPVTHQVTVPQQPIAGSGILATTLPDAPLSLEVGNVTVLTPQGNIIADNGGIVQQPLNGNVSLAPTLTLTAGTRAADGSVIYPGNIDAGDSGVIGVNTTLNAAGDISGFIIAQGNATVNAAANVSGTFLAGGTASFSAVGTISGIAIGGQAVTIGSGTFSGVALSQNVSGGGAQTALATSATASTTSQTAAAQSDNAQKTDTSGLAASSDDDDLKKHGKHPLLAKYVGRVTVLLPKTAPN